MRLKLVNLSSFAGAGALALLLLAQQAVGQQSGVPDAPSPQPPPLSTLTQGVQPGSGTANAAPGDQTPKPAPPTGTLQPVGAAPVAGTGPDTPGSQDINKSSEPAAGDEQYQNAPIIGENGRDLAQISKPLRISTNFVIVPVTVRDKQNHLVAGLTWRDFQVFEDGRRMHLNFFSSDPIPMSIAIVVDQALTSDVMKRVNEALKAIPGAFAAYDEVTVFTYANGAEQQTDFTAALGDRLPAILARSQGVGREMGPPGFGGPFDSGPTINGQQVDPNLTPIRNSGPTVIIPKEIYTLNDAIFAAGKALASRERERRRVIYVISDGKEQGSKLSQKEVIRFLLTNNIAVYGTVVGDSAVWGLGYLDKIHLPLLPRNNILPRYAEDTGGTLDSETSRDGIERSFMRVTEAARTAYTLGYNSPIPVTDPAERHIEVRVDRPGMTVQAKDHYYPTAVRQQQ